MNRQGNSPRGTGWRKRALLTLTTALLAALCVAIAAQAQDPDDHPPVDTGDLPVDPQWLANTLTRASTTTSVKNNTVDGAIQRRDAAIAAWRQARADYRAHKRG